MIQNSFIILEKVGQKKERKLWEQGITTWEMFLKAKKISGIASDKKSYYDRKIKKAKENLYALNSAYFCRLMPRAEHWRLYSFFREEAIFLDIETSGLADNSGITVIGMSDGIKTKTMIRGINLDFGLLKKELEKYKLIVTFNGSVFDLPFIKKRHGNILPEIPHFDLRFACARIGLNSGLKETEKALGIKLLEVTTGGKGGGGATLTPEAKELISKYKQFNDKMASLMEKEFKHIFGKKKPV